MEDTNPDKIDPNAYDMIPEDLEWLGVKVHETVVQSDRFELYYDIARQLINMGKAYVCTCPAEDWRALKEKGQPCPHHDEDVATTMEKFEKMLAGIMRRRRPSSWSRRTCTTRTAIRDFVGLRIVKSTPHPLKGDRYCLYPMMNFSVAIDDHFLGLTHVLRGKDHLNNTQRQAYLFQYFGWKVPHYTHYGLVSVPDAILKTSTVGKGIKTGEYSGWDDVRLGTVRALAKRGFRPEAIRNYWVDCGIKETDVEFSWDNIYAYNKAIVDKTANRYFFVWDPVPLQICGVNELHAKAPRHPDHPELGNREFQLNSPIIIHVVEKDLNAAMEAGKVRLKDLGNVEFRSGKALYQGNDLSSLRKATASSTGFLTTAPPPRSSCPPGRGRTASSRACLRGRGQSCAVRTLRLREGGEGSAKVAGLLHTLIGSFRRRCCTPGSGRSTAAPRRRSRSGHGTG